MRVQDFIWPFKKWRYDVTSPSLSSWLLRGEAERDGLCVFLEAVISPWPQGSTRLLASLFPPPHPRMCLLLFFSLSEPHSFSPKIFEKDSRTALWKSYSPHFLALLLTVCWLTIIFTFLFHIFVVSWDEQCFLLDAMFSADYSCESLFSSESLCRWLSQGNGSSLCPHHKENRPSMDARMHSTTDIFHLLFIYC